MALHCSYLFYAFRLNRQTLSNLKFFISTFPNVDVFTLQQQICPH